MSFSSGTFSINSVGQPVVTGTVISSTAFNALTADLATGLSTCVLKDGTQTLTANIPMAAFKLTGLGAGTTNGDSLRFEQIQGTALTTAPLVSQVQNQSFAFLTSVAGTNTITGTATPTPAAYAAGQVFYVLPANTNTGAATLNVSGLGGKNIFSGGGACTGGELAQNVLSALEYDGTQFEILGPRLTSGTFTVTMTGMTAGTTATAKFTIFGNVVTLTVPILTGTSNSTGCTLTGLPNAINPVTAHAGFPCVIADNGSTLASPGRADVLNSNVITLTKDLTSGVFTNTGTKGLSAGLTITYDLT